MNGQLGRSWGDDGHTSWLTKLLNLFFDPNQKTWSLVDSITKRACLGCYILHVVNPEVEGILELECKDWIVICLGKSIHNHSAIIKITPTSTFSY
jgi:hypothetical protein